MKQEEKLVNWRAYLLARLVKRKGDDISKHEQEAANIMDANVKAKERERAVLARRLDTRWICLLGCGFVYR